MTEYVLIAISGRLDSNQRPLEPHSSALNQTALRPDYKITGTN